jgi:hypothetical protein
LIFLVLMSCVGWLEPDYDDYYSMTWLNTAVQWPTAASTDVVRAEDFLIPYEWYADSTDANTLSRCLSGEDVRDEIPSHYAHMEIEWSSIKVGDMSVTWLESGAVPSYDMRGDTIGTLYDGLMTMRREAQMLSGACFPLWEGKLLVTAAPEVPAELLMQAMATADAVGFSQMYFAVQDPSAVSAAQKSPPRPPFSPSAPPPRSVPEPLPPSQVADGRLRLQQGLYLIDKDRQCKDRGWLDLSGGAMILRTEENLGGALQDGWQSVPSTLDLGTTLAPVLGAGDIEFWISHPSSGTTEDLLEVASVVARETEEPALFVPSGVAYSGTWTATNDWRSLEHDEWIAVIPMHVGGTPPARPCIDDTGALHRVQAVPPAIDFGLDFENLKW